MTTKLEALKAAENAKEIAQEALKAARAETCAARIAYNTELLEARGIKIGSEGTICIVKKYSWSNGSRCWVTVDQHSGYIRALPITKSNRRNMARNSFMIKNAEDIQIEGTDK